MRPSPRAASASVLGPLLGLLLTVAASAARGDEEPFEIETLRTDLRVLEVHAAALSEAARDGRSDLVLAAVEGLPPAEQRRLLVLSPDASGRYATARRVVPVPDDVVAFDLADVDGRPGDELVLLGTRELIVLDARAPEKARRIPLAPELARPPRTRGIGRLELVGPWHGDDRPTALIPAVDGARLLRLDSGATTHLAVPILAGYETELETPPPDGLLIARLEWPDLVLADDDGDARPDLFALDRYHVRVFRAGDDGLPAEPSRTLEVPTDAEAELRPEASSVRIYARDLDGDGLGDLVVHRTGGSLLESHASIRVHRNTGSGAVLDKPDAEIEVGGSLGQIVLADLDGDRRVEILESTIEFGVFQIVRLLVTRRAQVGMRVLHMTPPAIAGLESSWRDGISLPLDFGQARVRGILPTIEGDWNLDGRRDLLYARDEERIAVRLGVVEDGAPGFGGRAASQRVPRAAASRIGDLDGDGLDDLVLYDPRDAAGIVHVLHNRGVLPGTPPRLEIGPRS